MQQRRLGRVIVVNAMLSPMVSHDLVHNAACRCAEVLRKTCTLSDETKLSSVVVQSKDRLVMTLHRLLPAPCIAQTLPQDARATTPRLFIRPVTAPRPNCRDGVPALPSVQSSTLLNDGRGRSRDGAVDCETARMNALTLILGSLNRSAARTEAHSTQSTRLRYFSSAKYIVIDL